MLSFDSDNLLSKNPSLTRVNISIRLDANQYLLLKFKLDLVIGKFLNFSLGLYLGKIYVEILFFWYTFSPYLGDDILWHILGLVVPLIQIKCSQILGGVNSQVIKAIPDEVHETLPIIYYFQYPWIILVYPLWHRW